MQVLIRNRKMRVNARAGAALIRSGIAREVQAPAPAVEAPPPAPPAPQEAQSRTRRTYRRRDIEHAPESVVMEPEAPTEPQAPADDFEAPPSIDPKD